MVGGAALSSTHWLWLVAAAPAIYFLHRVRDDVRARWVRYIQPDLLDHLIVSRKARWSFRPIHMACLLILVGGVAAAGPTWKSEQPPFTEDKAPLAIVLDLSPTMDAIDLDPTRLERAKMKLRDLSKVRNGGRTALFVYAGTTYMVLPFTTDFSLFDLYLSSLSTGLMPENDKDSTKALRTVEEFLKTSRCREQFCLSPMEWKRGRWRPFISLPPRLAIPTKSWCWVSELRKVVQYELEKIDS